MSLSDWARMEVSWSDWTRSSREVVPGQTNSSRKSEKISENSVGYVVIWLDTDMSDVIWLDEKFSRSCPGANRIDVSWSDWMRNYLLDRRCQSNNKCNIMSWSECRVRKKREKMWEFGGPWTVGLWGKPRKEVRTRWTVRKKREKIRKFGGPGTTGSCRFHPICV